MDYSKSTQNLIDGMRKIAERKDYKLDKKKCEELIFKTYDLFDLHRPKKIKWHIDLDEKFLDRASSAYRAYSAFSASSASRASRASSAYRAYSAFSASSASRASSAYRAYSAFSASSAYRASSAYSASSAYRAYSAYRASSVYSASSAYRAYSAFSASLDYDFDWFVFTFEYNKANEDGNAEDKKYLEYFRLLLEAKENGLGYWCDINDEIHFAPVPLIECDSQGRYSSLDKPAIYWKGGEGIYYISGVEFDKKLWAKVTSGEIKAEEVFAIENMEQRRIAYEQMDKLKMRKLPDYKLLDEVEDDGYGNAMKLVSFNLKGYNTPFYYLNCFCPSTGREYFLETREKTCWAAKMGSFGLSEKDRFANEW